MHVIAISVELFAIALLTYFTKIMFQKFKEDLIHVVLACVMLIGLKSLRIIFRSN